MVEKLFPLDKNYLFRQAQADLEEELLELMVAELKNAYSLWYNPLGIMDDTSIRIFNEKEFPQNRITIIYAQLCGIYRYHYTDNQLELLFDGRSHLEKYREDWVQQFKIWTKVLGTHPRYVRPMLRMTVLFDTDSRAEFAENRCKSFINEHFGIKIIKRKGVLKIA